MISSKLNDIQLYIHSTDTVFKFCTITLILYMAVSVGSSPYITTEKERSNTCLSDISIGYLNFVLQFAQAFKILPYIIASVTHHQDQSYALKVMFSHCISERNLSLVSQSWLHVSNVHCINHLFFLKIGKIHQFFIPSSSAVPTLCYLFIIFFLLNSLHASPWKNPETIFTQKHLNYLY